MRRADFGRLLRAAVAAGALWLVAGVAAGETTVEIAIEGVVVTENPDPARLNQVPVSGFGQAVSVPYDPATGLATGSRRFRPVLLTKESDKSTPKLLEALANNQQVDVVIRFYDEDSDPTPSFQVVATDGILLSLSTGSIDYLPQEQVSFSFSQIAWTDVGSGATHVENWAPGP